MRPNLITVVALALSGCAVAVESEAESDTADRPASPIDTQARGHLASAPVDVTPGIDVPSPELPPRPAPPSVAEEDGEPDLCLLAVEEEGPCSLACDNDAVIEAFVPEGTCLVFTCDLTTGDHLRVGGCR